MLSLDPDQANESMRAWGMKLMQSSNKTTLQDPTKARRVPVVLAALTRFGNTSGVLVLCAQSESNGSFPVYTAHQSPKCIANWSLIMV